MIHPGGAPPGDRVCFTGTLVDLGSEPEVAGALRTFEVLVNGQSRWAFVIKEAKNMTRGGTTMDLLKDIFPQQLNFVGDEELLEHLGSPEIAGKMIRVEGTLYQGNSFFHVTRIEVASKEGTPMGSAR